MSISSADTVLVTGATGFLGSRVVARLVDGGFSRIRCLARPSSDVARIDEAAARRPGAAVSHVIRGNLLSREDCARATRDVAVIYHLAAGTGQKSFSDAYLNSVVTTRNLLESARSSGCVRRFVNVSSLAVYTNRDKPRRDVLDECCPVE